MLNTFLQTEKNTITTPTSVWMYCLLIVALIICAVCYYPGLKGEFILDDDHNIIQNTPVHIQDISYNSLKAAALSSNSGSLKRPLSMVSFSLNYYFSGNTPFTYKLTNLIIHLTCGVFIFFLTKLLLRSYFQNHKQNLSSSSSLFLSLAIAFLWLVHPLNLSTTLYVVQRMTSLASLFMLIGMVLYCIGRNKLNSTGAISGSLFIVFSTLVFTTLAVFSKENGILLPLYLLIIESIIFRFKCNNKKSTFFVYGFFFCIVGLPAVGAGYVLMFRSEMIIGGYGGRTFSLAERLMTEARALWFYLQMMIFPSISKMSLYHDSFALSRSIFSPWQTFPSVIGIVSLFCAGMALIRKYPLASFGILWFFASHSLESTIIPLEIIFEHRNYLATYGVIFTLTIILFTLPIPGFLLKYRVPIFIVLALYCAFITHLRAIQWGDPLTMAQTEAEHHPSSPRAQYALGRLMVILNQMTPNENYLKTARQAFLKASENDEQDISGLIGLVFLQATTNIPIEKDRLLQLRHRLETIKLTPVTASHIRTLTACKIKKTCPKIPNEIIILIAEAAIKNKHGSGRTKGLIYSQYANFLGYSLQQWEKAFEMHQKALKTAPNAIPFRFHLAEMQIFRNQLVEAEKTIKKAEKMDNLGKYTKDISILRQMLISKAPTPIKK